MKLVLALLGAVWCASACSTTDDRPENLAYVTEAILAPSCATAECHSAMKRVKGYAFDNVELAQQSLAGGTDMVAVLIGQCDAPPCDPTASYLLTVLNNQDVEGDRMPLDAAMPQEDIDFLTRWIRDGATGYLQPGP